MIHLFFIVDFYDEKYFHYKFLRRKIFLSQNMWLICNDFYDKIFIYYKIYNEFLFIIIKFWDNLIVTKIFHCKFNDNFFYNKFIFKIHRKCFLFFGSVNKSHSTVHAWASIGPFL